MKRYFMLVLAMLATHAQALVPPASRSATTAATAAKVDSSYIGPDGTAHVTRIVPLPRTVSAQAQSLLARPVSDAPDDATLAQQRRAVDAWQAGARRVFLKRYPAQVSAGTIAGVPVRVAMPLAMPPDHRDDVLIDLHGGGFVLDSGSWTESIPMAHLTRTRVVAVLYPLAPEHPFPAAVDAVVKVYRALLKTHRPRHIVIYGSSAGAVLTAEVAVALKQRHLPLPAALGVFSGFGDFSRPGDSMALFTLNGLSGPLTPPRAGAPLNPRYVGKTDPHDPELSPLFADLHGLPPTLFLTSTRDLLLSGTTILERAFRRDGVHTRLIVYEALPHTFWNNLDLPEARQAQRDMAGFFNAQLYGSARVSTTGTAGR